MDQEQNPNRRRRINLDLTLGPPSQEEQQEQQEQVEEEVPVKEQGPYMKLLIQPPPLLPPHPMTPPGYYTYTYPWDVSGASRPSSPPLGVVSDSPSPYQPSGQLPQHPQANQEASRTAARLGRPPAANQARRSSSRAVAAATVEKNAGEKEIIPPYPWATTRPAVIHSLGYLCANNINVIWGQVQCRPCDKTRTLEYNLREKFDELYRYIKENKEELRHRAPHAWLSPKLTPCGSCESGMKPVISENKDEINWLFLLLGQMLGCCTLDQLRHFCQRNKEHRTGAKDRVLYLTYLGLFKQLEPCELFSQL